MFCRLFPLFVAFAATFTVAVSSASADSTNYIRSCVHVRTVSIHGKQTTTQTRYTPTNNRCIRATGTVIGDMPLTLKGYLVHRLDFAFCVSGTHHPSHPLLLDRCAPDKGIVRPGTAKGLIRK
jgi:hypothetical protein